MAADTNTFSASNLIIVVLVIVAAGLVFFVLTGRPLPLIGDDRGALLALGIIGFTMCWLGGIGKVQATLGWAHPITIVGMILGVAAMLVVILPLINVKLPVLETERSAFIALALIMLVKLGLSGLGQLLA